MSNVTFAWVIVLIVVVLTILACREGYRRHQLHRFERSLPELLRRAGNGEKLAYLKIRLGLQGFADSHQTLSPGVTEQIRALDPNLVRNNGPDG